jgi:hypothetical protein
MTVSELIAELETYPGDAQVKLMTQPNYPLVHTIDMVNMRSDYDDDFSEDDGESDDVYILEGSQEGYGDKAAWG